jgi:5-methylthioadenosine/S-adenosylhomocysteine deaminase
MLLTMDSERRLVRAALAVVGDRIAGIGPGQELRQTLGPPRETLDAGGMLVIPGLVNAHTHLFQSAIRGFGDGLDLHGWHEAITQPFYLHLTGEDVYWFSLLGAIENVRAGVTTVINFQAFPNDVASMTHVADAIGAAGIRGVVAKACYGRGVDARLLSSRRTAMSELRTIFTDLHGSHDGRVRFCVGFPTAMAAPSAWIAEAHEIARAHQTGLHTHIAETAQQAASAMTSFGMTEVAYLARLGVVDEHFHGAHGVHLTDADMGLIAEAGATVVHCPVSNMYLGSGAAEVPLLLSRGVNVAAGSDGSATNNNQDMFLVMRMASLLPRVVHRDPKLVAPGLAVEMATVNGAKAASIDAGALEAGRLADFALVDLSRIHNQPLHRPVSALVNSAHSEDVDTVVVGGRVIMRARQIIGVDEMALISESNRRAKRVWRAAGLLDRFLSWPWT